jgi:GMP synthase (glutamine-hydrolysing)
VSRPFLVIQLRPEDEAADSELGAIARYGGLGPDEVVRVRVERTSLPEIDLADYSAIIVGGSPFDLSAPELSKPPIQRTIERDFMRLLERVAAADFPFLGACSGSGLVGRFCGARLSGTYAEPVGGADVTVTEAGTDEPLLLGSPRTFRALVGHKEACDDVPPGTVLLASSAACPVQMFRLGANVYATQFHPEADPAEIALRIEVYKHHGYFAPDTTQALIAAVAGEETPFAQQILGRFVRRYRAI